MYKVLIPVLAVLIIGAGIFVIYDRKDSNDYAQNHGRSLTIINETGQVINEIHVTVGKGTEVEDMQRKNIDKKSLSIKIPKNYADRHKFTVILVDRYEVQYKKTVKNVLDKGPTEVVVSEKDIVKESNSVKKKIDKFFNGD